MNSLNDFAAARQQVETQATEARGQVETAYQERASEARQFAGGIETQLQAGLGQARTAEEAGKRQYVAGLGRPRKVDTSALTQAAGAGQQEIVDYRIDLDRTREAALADVKKWADEQTSAIDAAEMQFRFENVELNTGEWVKRAEFDALPQNLQNKLKELGIDKFNRLPQPQQITTEIPSPVSAGDYWWDEQGNRLYMVGGTDPKTADFVKYDEWVKLDKSSQDYLMQYGVAKFNEQQKQQTLPQWGDEFVQLPPTIEQINVLGAQERYKGPVAIVSGETATLYPSYKEITQPQPAAQTISLPLAIWRAITPWEEEKETAFGYAKEKIPKIPEALVAYIKNTPDRLLHPVTESQENLKAEYEARQQAWKTMPWWYNVFFGGQSVAYAPSAPEGQQYQRIIMGEVPLVGGAGRVVTSGIIKGVGKAFPEAIEKQIAQLARTMTREQAVKQLELSTQGIAKEIARGKYLGWSEGEMARVFKGLEKVPESKLLKMSPESIAWKLHPEGKGFVAPAEQQLSNIRGYGITAKKAVTIAEDAAKYGIAEKDLAEFFRWRITTGGTPEKFLQQKQVFDILNKASAIRVPEVPSGISKPIGISKTIQYGRGGGIRTIGETQIFSQPRAVSPAPIDWGQKSKIAGVSPLAEGGFAKPGLFEPVGQATRAVAIPKFVSPVVSTPVGKPATIVLAGIPSPEPDSTIQAAIKSLDVNQPTQALQELVDSNRIINAVGIDARLVQNLMVEARDDTKLQTQQALGTELSDLLKQGQAAQAETLAKSIVKAQVDPEAFAQNLAKTIQGLQNQGATQAQIKTAVQEQVKAQTKGITSTQAKALVKQLADTALKQVAATQLVTVTAPFTIKPSLPRTRKGWWRFPLPPLLAESPGEPEEPLPEGTVVWKGGAFWKAIPPKESGVKPFSTRKPPAGVRTTGRTPKETFQVAGGVPMIEADIDLGVVDVFVDEEGIEFKGHGERTNVGKRHQSTTKGMTIRRKQAMPAASAVRI